MKLAVQVPARERVGRDCVSRREGVAGSFSERLPPCLELPGALEGMRGFMAVVGGDMGEGASSSCLGGSERNLAWGALRCVSLSAIWPFQGDVLIFCQLSVRAASSHAIPGRSQRRRVPLSSLSRLMHAAAPNTPGLAKGSPGASPG